MAGPSPAPNSTYSNAIKNARRNVRCRIGRLRDVGEKRHEPVIVNIVTDRVEYENRSIGFRSRPSSEIEIK